MTSANSTLQLAIDGMHCGSCALLIDDTLADVPGVLSATTSSKHRRATVVHDNRATHADIIAAIHDLGYHATAL